MAVVLVSCSIEVGIDTGIAVVEPDKFESEDWCVWLL